MHRHNRHRISRLAFCAISLAAITAAACGGGGEPSPTPSDLFPAPPVEMTVGSPDFSNGGDIPARFTCDGEDISPQIEWSQPPAGTESLALIADDPDAPGGIFTHWVIYNLPPDARRVARGVAGDAELENGASQGMNDFDSTGYRGPCPPEGEAHEYRFLVFAVGATLEPGPDASAEDLLRAMQGNLLGQGSTTGMYARR